MEDLKQLSKPMITQGIREVAELLTCLKENLPNGDLFVSKKVGTRWRCVYIVSYEGGYRVSVCYRNTNVG